MFLKKVIKLAVFALILSWLYGRITFFKFGHFHHTQWPGKCRQVLGISEGSEDAEIVTGDLALITSGLCFMGEGHCQDHKGQILLFDFNDPDGVKPVTIKWKPKVAADKKKNFHPHGISVWHQNDEPTVMIVNHEPAGDTVEIFSFHVKTQSLLHLESISDLANPGLLNDVRSTGPRSFYYTVSLLYIPLEIILGLPFGWVGYYDGDSARAVAEWLGFPNGVHMSTDGRYVYVSHGFSDAIRVYQRQENNNLTLIKEVAINVLPDNIIVDPTDQSLWVGTSSVLWKTNSDGGFAQILKLEVENGLPTGKIHQVFSDNYLDSGFTKSSSVGLHHKSKLLIGSIYDKAAVCDVHYLP